MATDNDLSRDKLLALATLWKEAVCIEHDLSGRLSQNPKERSLLKQHRDYQQVVGQLTCELERSLELYLARIKAAAGPGDRADIKPSLCASAAFPHDVLPRNKLLALATLLKEALCIEHDLTVRLFQYPKEKSLLKQHKEYQQLVGQLTYEFDRALARYLARITAAAGPGD